MGVAAIAVVACATGPAPVRERLGEIQFRSYTDPTASPVTYTVQSGRIFNPNLDLSVGADGCISGTVRGGSIRACSSSKAPAPKNPQDVVQTWTGVTGGNFTVELTEDGKRMSMIGFIQTTGRLNIPMQGTVPLGTGAAWDEMRTNPALLALAAAVAGVRGTPSN